MDTNTAQNSGEEVIPPVKLKGQIVILFSDCRDVLGSTGIHRASIFAADVFFKPTLIRNLDMKSIHKRSIHNVLNLEALRKLETPERISLRRLK